MSNIVETGAELATRISTERSARRWSLADLAARSDVSKAMLSKIEREEASPTASVLLRIATAFEMTLAELLAESGQPGTRLLRAANQATWTDPATGYRRRQIYLSARLPLELVEIDLPAGSSVPAPASSYVLIRQVVWVIEGRLTILEGDRSSALEPGDSLEFGPPADCIFRNESDTACRYLVAVLRR